MPLKMTVRGAMFDSGIGLDAVVAGDDVQHVQQLAFVFVDAFGLTVEQWNRVKPSTPFCLGYMIGHDAVCWRV